MQQYVGPPGIPVLNVKNPPVSVPVIPVEIPVIRVVLEDTNI